MGERQASLPHVARWMSNRDSSSNLTTSGLAPPHLCQQGRLYCAVQETFQIKVSLGCTHPLAARDIARGGVLAQHVPVRAS